MVNAEYENGEAERFTPNYSDPGSVDYSEQQFGRERHLGHLKKLETDRDISKLEEFSLDLFYSTRESSEDIMKSFKSYVAHGVADSVMRDTIREFGLNFVAHRGMFPGSDLVFGAGAAYDGLKSDMKRNDIDFCEKYRNWIQNINIADADKISDEDNFSYIEEELGD